MLARLAEVFQELGLDATATWEFDRAGRLVEMVSGDPAFAGLEGRTLAEIVAGHPHGGRALEAFQLAAAGFPSGYNIEWDGRWYRDQMMPHWRDGTIVGVTGWSLPTPRPPNDSGTAEPERELEVAGYLLRDVPQANALAGDRVVFRPRAKEPERQCLVMHSADPAAFVEVLANGGVEIIGSRPSSVAADARRLLLGLLRRPRRRLALVR